MVEIIQLIQILILTIMYGTYSYQAVSNSKFAQFIRKHGIAIILTSVIIIFLLSFLMFIV